MTQDQYLARAVLAARIIVKAQELILAERAMGSIPWHADWNEELMAVLRGDKDIAHPRAAGTVDPDDN